MDYKKNLQYFGSIPTKYFIIAIVVGLFFLMTRNNLLGWVIILAAVGIFVYLKYNQITDAEYDSSVINGLVKLKPRALKALNIDEEEVQEAAPISLGGYRFDGATKVKTGKDGLTRTDKYEQLMVLFSSNEIYFYTKAVSTISAVKSSEATDVYFYNDIVSISTKTESTKIGSKSVDYVTLTVLTTAGSALSVAIPSADEDVQRSINGMRSLIKAKKTA